MLSICWNCSIPKISWPAPALLENRSSRWLNPGQPILPDARCSQASDSAEANSGSSATRRTVCFSLVPRPSIQAFETTWMGSTRIHGATSERAPPERSEQAGQWPCSESQDCGRRCCFTVPYALHLAAKSGISKHDIDTVLKALRDIEEAMLEKLAAVLKVAQDRLI